MQWTVWLETRTTAGEVKTTELATFKRATVVGTLAEVGLVLAVTTNFAFCGIFRADAWPLRGGMST